MKARLVNKPELLAPAGTYEKLEYAYLYGADAAYVSGIRFGMRSRAGNFTDIELSKALDLARSLGKRLYVTVNTVIRNNDLNDIKEYLRFLDDIGIDAVIVADPGVLRLVRSLSSTPIHISTQTNTLNTESVGFWADNGARRICLARELSKDEILDICGNASIEIEVFVHGAMCISYSGRCLISKYMSGRDANTGDCAQPCRWRYSLIESSKKAAPAYPIAETADGTYLYNSKDLNLASRIPELIDAGVSAFKIEGRMKSVNYIAAVTKVYREIIDTYAADPSKFEMKHSWSLELQNVSHRAYTEGFYADDQDARVLDSAGYAGEQTFVATVQSSSGQGSVLAVRDRMSSIDGFIAIPPIGQNISFKVNEFIDPAGFESKDIVHANDSVFIKVPNLPPKSIIRADFKKEVRV